VNKDSRANEKHKLAYAYLIGRIGTRQAEVEGGASEGENGVKP
jgi:hypothetical protein